MPIIKSAPIRLVKRTRCQSVIEWLIIFGAGLLISACNSGGSHSSSANTPNPTIEGPIAGTPTLLGTTTFDLATVGYQQSEYFISGTARSYTSNTAPSDGKWSVRVADTADFKTRVLVYRPIDAAAFNGTVIVEWLNVSGGPDVAAEWMVSHNELIRKGYAWVGISAQSAGIQGGGVNFSELALDLKTVNPTRYGTLTHPGDKYAFDIFSQAAQAVLHPKDIDPLTGLLVQRALAVGESQSADFLVTYVNAIAKSAKLFDGYFIHSRFRGTVGLNPPVFTSEGIDFLARPSVLVRDDLEVPVMMFQTETDILMFGSYSERQPDGAHFRLWEVAGTAHADIYSAQTGLGDTGNDPSIAAVVEQAFPLYGCTTPVNSGPQHFVASAAIAALDNWVRNGIAPAYADRIEVAGNPPAFVKDSVGNVLGGVRTPYVDVPVAKLSGEGQTGNLLCTLFGTTQLFNSTQLASLYSDHATFISEINTSVDSAVRERFLLQPDGDLIKTWAQTSNIGAP